MQKSTNGSSPSDSKGKFKRKTNEVRYAKHGDEKTGLFESQLFAIKDDLLKDFLTQQNVKIPKMTEELGIRVSPMRTRYETTL